MTTVIIASALLIAIPNNVSPCECLDPNIKQITSTTSSGDGIVANIPTKPYFDSVKKYLTLIFSNSEIANQINSLTTSTVVDTNAGGENTSIPATGDCFVWCGLCAGCIYTEMWWTPPCLFACTQCAGCIQVAIENGAGDKGTHTPDNPRPPGRINIH